MKTFGSKDLMRMESIADKAGGIYNQRGGDFMTTAMYAFNMAEAITDPGKAMARGYAAQEYFGEYSPIAYIFFERAHKLGGENVRPMASENSWTGSNEDELLDGIPEEQLPASKRSTFKLHESFPHRKRNTSDIIALGKINVIKGNGPQFDLLDYPAGTIEVWETSEGKPRIIYVNNYEPNYLPGESRSFNITSVEKIETWKLVDYIETEFIANLGPLYGKSLMIYNYD